MKNIVAKTIFIALFAVALMVISCQEEFEEGGGDERETITASSVMASLISNTSSNDGSYDNIVDGASCLAVKFPYTVEANGIQISVASRKDFHVIEEIFDEVDVDEDVLDILFPITITFADFTELMIENQQQLQEFAAACLEGGNDDDIECIDFVYPITLFTFDINEQQTGEVLVQSDKDLHRFFRRLDDDIVSIQFPITLKKFDGTEIAVNNNVELANALENAKGECDEDDDNDFNDDDFTKERLDNYLVECPWKIITVHRTDVDQTDQYLEYSMVFSENGQVTVKDKIGNIHPGTWTTRPTNHGVALTLEFTRLVDFSLEWFVHEIGKDKIKLYAGEGNKIIMEQHCSGEDDDIISVEALTNTLQECGWIVEKIKNQGEKIERLLGYGFTFMEDGTVILGDGVTSVQGTWEVGSNSKNVRSLTITIIGDEPAVNFEWPLVHIGGPNMAGPKKLIFKDEASGYMMVLEQVCDNNAGGDDIAEIKNIVMGGSWIVANYTENRIEMTDDFAAMEFDFPMMYQVEVSIEDDPIAKGLWRIFRNTDGMLMFYLNIGGDTSLFKLTDGWHIDSVEASRVTLVHEEENLIKNLVLGKP